MTVGSIKMPSLQRNLTFNFKSKIRSPLLKKSKKSRTESELCKHSVSLSKVGVTADQKDQTCKTQSSHLHHHRSDEAMPLKKGLKSRSTENLSRNQITNNRLDKHRSSFKQKDDNPICNLPLPLSLTLGISSLSDSKLYSYHNSQEFLTFLTKSARDVEEAERNHTIDTALTQIKELKTLVEENTKLLRFVQHTQEYNPSSEIDDIMVCNISKTLKEHRGVMEKMCERAKQYKIQLILAESDLDTNNSQEMKADLLAMNKTLSWMSMIIRYHTWGSNVADESLYHSDDDVINQNRKLGRRNCIRVRERPKWSEETAITVTPAPTKPGHKQPSLQMSNSRTNSKQTFTNDKLSVPSSGKQISLSRIASNVTRITKG